MSNKTTGTGNTDSKADDDDRLDQLAQRFLDLWREQVAATADGTQAASAIGRLYASLGADTSRMGEGFEAWGNLIGQMAMGQNPGMSPPDGASDLVNNLSGNMMKNPMTDALNTANPLQAMMDQMAKAARDLPTAPFPGTLFPGTPFPGSMPFGGNMASTDIQDDPSANSGLAGNVRATDTPTPKAGGKKPAKGQGKNDQSTTAKQTARQKNQPKAGRAKAASDAHGSRDDELAQLTRRIADLSETIAALEGRTPGTGGGSSDGD